MSELEILREFYQKALIYKKETHRTDVNASLSYDCYKYFKNILTEARRKIESL